MSHTGWASFFVLLWGHAVAYVHCRFCFVLAAAVLSSSRPPGDGAFVLFGTACREVGCIVRLGGDRHPVRLNNCCATVTLLY